MSSKFGWLGWVVLVGCGPTITVAKDDDVDGNAGALGQAAAGNAEGNTGGRSPVVQPPVVQGGEPGTGGGDTRGVAEGGTGNVPGGGAGGVAGLYPLEIGGAPVHHGGNGNVGIAGNGNTGEGNCVAPPLEFSLAEWQDPELPDNPEGIGRRIVLGMPGSWHGVATTPWTGPYEVNLTFEADGHYSGACEWSSNDCCVAYYYGTDADSELKQWSVDAVTYGGVVSGHIDIIYGDDASGFYESGYQGTFDLAELDATENRLRFDFMYGGEYGPIHYDLERVPEE